MLNGLSLFSGIGGLDVALAPWVRPITYCENEPYAQRVLLSRMCDGQLPTAPIWDDVRTLRRELIGATVDIIYGGFPCQDLSVAGKRAGLGGDRSGLFWEIIRLAEELKPSFIFLENVAQGIGKYEGTIVAAFEECGYTVAPPLRVSAFDVGANHRRLRWFCLAYANGLELRNEPGRRSGTRRESSEEHFSPTWWAREPGIPGVAHGVSHRMDRLRALGNAVVPAQARAAFEELMGLSSTQLDKVKPNELL